MIASTEQANSVALVLMERVQPLEYRRSTVFSVSTPVVSNSVISTAETRAEYVDGETATETTPTDDDNSMFVYVIGGISIACGVCVVVSCALVCTRRTPKNHPESNELHLNHGNTGVNYTPYDNMYVNIQQPLVTRGANGSLGITYYTR